jgi:hypothetical protein
MGGDEADEILLGEFLGFALADKVQENLLVRVKDFVFGVQFLFLLFLLAHLHDRPDELIVLGLIKQKVQIVEVLDSL